MNQNQKQVKLLKKVVIFGDCGVGKTSILDRYVRQRFRKLYRTSIGPDFMTKDVFIQNEPLTLQIWDSAGEERYQALAVRGADACVIVFDITNPDSFKSIEYWRKFYFKHGLIPPEGSRVVLLGNKVDLEQERKVSPTEAQAWCRANGGIPYFEVSAKDSLMVEEVFYTVAEAIYEGRIIEPINLESVILDETLSVHLNENNKERASKSKCAC